MLQKYYKVHIILRNAIGKARQSLLQSIETKSIALSFKSTNEPSFSTVPQLLIPLLYD